MSRRVVVCAVALLAMVAFSPSIGSIWAVTNEIRQLTPAKGHSYLCRTAVHQNLTLRVGHLYSHARTGAAGRPVLAGGVARLLGREV